LRGLSIFFCPVRVLRPLGPDRDSRILHLLNGHWLFLADHTVGGPFFRRHPQDLFPFFRTFSVLPPTALWWSSLFLTFLAHCATIFLFFPPSCRTVRLEVFLFPWIGPGFLFPPRGPFFSGSHLPSPFWCPGAFLCGPPPLVDPLTSGAAFPVPPVPGGSPSIPDLQKHPPPFSPTGVCLLNLKRFFPTFGGGRSL